MKRNKGKILDEAASLVAGTLSNFLQQKLGTVTGEPGPQQRVEALEAVHKLLKFGARVSAGELRSIGFNVPTRIPDCATVARSAIKLLPPKIQADPEDVGKLTIGIECELGGAFRWVDVTMQLVPDEEE